MDSALLAKVAQAERAGVGTEMALVGSFGFVARPTPDPSLKGGEKEGRRLTRPSARSPSRPHPHDRQTARSWR
jgi:hypothetical protein